MVKGIVFMEYRHIHENIYPEQFNETSKGILDWTKEFREKEEWAKDPNVFQMTNIFLLGAKYAEEGFDINKETLKELWDIRSKDFARCGVGEGSFVYGICEDAYKASQEEKAWVNDVDSHCALRTMADIGLVLYRQHYKGEEMKFDNAAQLYELIEDSRTLKTLHPDLYERYGFERNLEHFQNLQPENALSGKIQKAMDALVPQKAEEKKEVSEPQVRERE